MDTRPNNGDSPLRVLTELLESNDWNGKLVISPDVDGLVSANLISHLFNAELIGFYEVSNKKSKVLLSEGNNWSDAESALWLDHDIIDPRIISVGQHMIHPYSHSTFGLNYFDDRPDYFEFDRGSPFQRHEKSFNPHDFGRFGWDNPQTFPICNQQGCDGIAFPNDEFCRRHGGEWTKTAWNAANAARGFRRKYPFATIHLLLAALRNHEFEITPNAKMIIAHSDSAWLAATQNANNAEWWLYHALESEPNAERIAGTNPRHTTSRGTMLEHLHLIWSLDDRKIINLASDQREQRESGVRELSIYSAGFTKANKQHLHPNWHLHGNLDELASNFSNLTGWNFSAAAGSLTTVAQGDSSKMDPRKPNQNSWEETNFGSWLNDQSVFSLAFTGMDVVRFTTGMETL